MRRVFSELGKAEHSRRGQTASDECKHRIFSFNELATRQGKALTVNLVDAPGIAPGSSDLQTDADLSQLNAHKNGGTERTRTVMVFVDSEVHKPFCHGPM